MKKSLVSLLVSFFVLFAVSVQAADFSGLKKKVAEARESLLVMIKITGKQGPDQQKRVKETADAVSEMLSVMKAPPGKEAQFKELVDTWSIFKKLREEEIVPLILSDKREEADKLAGGAQRERYKKVKQLCDELGK